MRVHYKTTTIEYEEWTNETYYINVLNPDYCCDEMKKAWLQDAIGFEENSRRPEVCISKCSPYPEGASWDYYKINHCPFCGEDIVLIEKEKVRKVPRKVTKTVEKIEYDEIKESD